MQNSLQKLISEFEKVINERITNIKSMLNELHKVCDSNVEVIAVHEDMQRVKNAIDLA